MAAPVAALFSCGTCRVKFADLEFMQAHYKCDWHRYNLKRKVAALPPIGVESFAEIVKAYQSEAPKTGEGTVGGSLAKPQADKLYCKECAKSFLNLASHAAHLGSKRHGENSRTYSDMSSDGSTAGSANENQITPEDGKEVQKPIASVDHENDWEDDEEGGTTDLPPYDITVCLFCSKKCPSLEANLQHMSTAHSFFIPDFDFCSDVAGLIDYLGKKVTDGHLCLFCNQHFQNQTAVQRHMESKGHTKLGYEENYLLEYEEFFDFSPEGEGEESDAPSGRVDDDLALDGSGYEMTLPSGATIGHRDLRAYYRQSLRPVTEVALLNRVTRHYKALGWSGGHRESGYAQDMMQKISQLKQQQQKSGLQVGMKTNKIMMKHYRRQYGF